jgi:hypothetical protein
MWATRLLLVLAACDFAPPPAKKQPPPPPAPTPMPVVAVDAAVAPADADFVTDACVDMAAHVIDVTISAIPDANERGAQDRVRAHLVRQLAEDCSRRKWPQTALDCFANATKPESMNGCDKLIPVEAPQKPATKPSAD